MMCNKRGFTLIELLVVVFITAVMGGVGYQILGTSVRMSDATADHTKELNQLSRAMNWLERDVTQFIGKPVRGELGEAVPSLVVADQALSFTQLGHSNALDKAQSQLQRVTYQVVNNGLQRVVWSVLDQVESSTPQIQELTPSTRFSVQVLTTEGWYEQWPINSSLPGQERSSIAIALRINLDTPRFGVITRLFELPCGLTTQRKGEQ
ncbi:type II secretion system minor pseudopilin GspJ [Marinomonas atlantica]|uniref:type II secretion system minor pseudopilin GspJ n=1 Tax=Marinomonas atlantica TaxID=1806668 RepID=UPI00083608D3|nr:type II secretion system minor pseudopilin GspJ [Marinomonas atlantica]